MTLWGKWGHEGSWHYSRNDVMRQNVSRHDIERQCQSSWNKTWHHKTWYQSSWNKTWHHSFLKRIGSVIQRQYLWLRSSISHPISKTLHHYDITKVLNSYLIMFLIYVYKTQEVSCKIVNLHSSFLSHSHTKQVWTGMREIGITSGLV